MGQSVEVLFGSIVGQSPIAHSCGSGCGAEPHRVGMWGRAPLHAAVGRDVGQSPIGSGCGAESPIAHSCGSGRGAEPHSAQLWVGTWGGVPGWGYGAESMWGGAQLAGCGARPCFVDAICLHYAMGQSPTWRHLWGRAPRGGTYGAEPHIGAVMGQSPTWRHLWGSAVGSGGYGAEPHVVAVMGQSPT